MSEKRLGEFELAVLTSIIELGDSAYGVPIREKLEEKSGQAVAVGAVYTTLSRLEKKGYVSSRHGEPTAERGGRAKKFYRVEASGHAAVERTLKAMQAALTNLSILGGAS